MKQSGKCPKCGSTALIPNVALVAAEGPGANFPVKLRVEQNPSALMMKWAVQQNLDAFVCSGCGYTEFYAKNPGELHRAFLESQKPPKT